MSFHFINLVSNLINMSPSKKITAIALILIFGLNCTNQNKVTKVIKDIVPDFLNNFSVNPNPNNLDTVGIIFSIDKSGKITPIANLDLRTNSEIVMVPKEIDSTNI